jgi:hypothetical protein
MNCARQASAFSDGAQASSVSGVDRSWINLSIIPVTRLMSGPVSLDRRRLVHLIERSLACIRTD